MKLVIDFLLFQEGEIWVGQGVQHDLCAQGASEDQVHERIRTMVAGTILMAAMNDQSPQQALPEPMPRSCLNYLTGPAENHRHIVLWNQ